MQKQVQIRVRLSSSVLGSAAQVALTIEEYQAVKALAFTYGYGDKRGVSTLIRRLAELAAGDSTGFHDVHTLLTAAAAKSGLTLGSFMRMCVLEAIGTTQLKTQLDRVAQGVEDGRAKA